MKTTMSCCHRNPLSCIVPDYVLEQLAREKGEAFRKRMENTVARDQAMRAGRPTLARLATFDSAAGAPAGKDRRVYSAENTRTLRKRKIRSEGEGPSGNAAADKVYDFFGNTYDFYNTVFNRDSIDGQGMPMIGTVEVGPHYANAFWNGMEMGFGTGDGLVFNNFVDSLDVIGHELTHGVVQFNGNGGLAYSGQKGALNESMADVFGALVKQFVLGQSASSADWLIGAEIMVSDPCLRSMADPHDGLGTSPNGTPGQPKNMSEYDQTSLDDYGVHINSGIPNHVFYQIAMKLGGNAWDIAGKIWYDTLTKGNLPPGDYFDPESGTTFQMFADKTMEFAGPDQSIRQKLADSWAAVEIYVSGAPPVTPTTDSGLRNKLIAVKANLEEVIASI
jgi:Zn-dependent metalloprotease